MKTGYLAIAGLLAASAPATAGPFADDLGRCAVDASTEADRTALVRWMFVSAAANPAFADLSAVSDAERDRSLRAAAAVFDRILLRDCRRESVAAMRNEGGAGIEAGFQTLGQLAGREMMASPAGAASLARLGSYMDIAGLEVLHREAGVRTAAPR
jgi:hypothetical protein